MSAITITLNIFCKSVFVMRFILEIFSSVVFSRVSLNFSFSCAEFSIEESVKDVIISCDVECFSRISSSFCSYEREMSCNDIDFR